MLKKDKDQLRDFQLAREYEWLETNGLGGWAGSTLVGAHTRRYHGLLVAAIVPPAERMVMLSKLDETIISGSTRYELGVNQYPGHTLHPQGHQWLENFTKEIFPQWTYVVNGITLRKTIAMLQGENTTLVIYDVLKSTAPFTLELLPLVAGRGYHTLQQEGPQLYWDAGFDDGIFHTLPDGRHPLYINIPGASYRHDPRWYRDFEYAVEQYRGLDYREDLLNHGIFSIDLKEGDTLGIIISTDDPRGRHAAELLEKEKQRRLLLLKDQPGDETFMQLVLAADQFIVQRDASLKTIIAGYHWFTDWGRDTMISLPGLCLRTGRFEDARKILAAFAKSVSQGMLPNRFRDQGEAPEYNNADGTLWYFIAVHQYLQSTGDRDFVLQEILPVLKEIIDWHFRGTRYNIRSGEDGLLFAGEPGQQLTWMDARIGTWVVTPRMGRPVEIQALWYNTLKIFAELLVLNGQPGDAGRVNASAEKTKRSFTEKFWYADGNYLYDVLDENNKPDPTIRPNQLFAISLPFPLVEGEKAKAVLDLVNEKLYTPVGLKSLPEDDIHYVPVYGGDPWHRDAAYHEGTVWSWLLGAYVDAIMKVRGDGARAEAMEVIDRFRYHLQEGCIGSVSEIFDATAPHHPRGCVAQAWSVAELLRVIKDYGLFREAPKKTRKRKSGKIVSE